MSRTLVFASALLALTAGIASAGDLVPGSDVAVREAQSNADNSVRLGSGSSWDRSESSYGYPIGRTDRTDSFVPTTRTGERGVAPVATSGSERLIVPGSDSF